MRVAVGNEMAAKGVNPIARRAHEAGLLALVLAADRAGILGHVRGLEGLVVVKNGRIKTAMIIFVGLDVKTVRKHPAAVAEQQTEKIIRLAAPVSSTLKPRLQLRRQAEAKNQQRDQQQKKCPR